MTHNNTANKQLLIHKLAAKAETQRLHQLTRTSKYYKEKTTEQLQIPAERKDRCREVLDKIINHELLYQ